MAGCLGGAVALCRTDVVKYKSWADSMDSLLSDEDGTYMFQDFLEFLGLDNEKKHLDFYRDCRDLPECDSPVDKARDIWDEFVEFREVNLDQNMVGRLKQALDEEDANEVLRAFTDAKEQAKRELNESYNEFKKQKLLPRLQQSVMPCAQKAPKMLKKIRQR